MRQFMHRTFISYTNYILQRPEVEPGLREELLRDEEDNKMICVSVQDDFVLKQDICVMCGSLGNDLEGLTWYTAN